MPSGDGISPHGDFKPRWVSTIPAATRKIDIHRIQRRQRDHLLARVDHLADVDL
jgi:hypothetical protein